MAMVGDSRFRAARRVGAALVALVLACTALPGGAAPASRQDALQDITSADSETRREAVAWFARDGGMEDVDVLAGALRDDAAAVREDAEFALVQVWSRSGDPAIDAQMQSGIRQMSAGLMGQAVDTFSRIIESRPDFAEGWNKRATVYFLMGQYDLSLRDCDEVMQRNPLHFGALSGYAMIYVNLGNLERALEYFEKALEVNPNLTGAQISAARIRQRLGGRQSI